MGRRRITLDGRVAQRLDASAERFGIPRNIMAEQIIRMNLPKIERESIFWILKEYPATAPGRER
jgi:hypothetical protein